MVSDTKHLFNLIYKLLLVSKVTKRLTILCLALVDDHSRLWRASHWQHISCRIQGQEAPVPIRSHLWVFGLVHRVLSCSELRLLTQVAHNISRGQVSGTRLAQTFFELTALLFPYNIFTILPLFYLHFIPKWKDNTINESK